MPNSALVHKKNTSALLKLLIQKFKGTVNSFAGCYIFDFDDSFKLSLFKLSTISISSQGLSCATTLRSDVLIVFSIGIV